MNFDLFAGRLERWEKAEDTNMVKTMEHLRSPQYLESSRPFGSWACQVSIVVLESIDEAIAMLDQRYPVVSLTGSMSVTDCSNE